MQNQRSGFPDEPYEPRTDEYWANLMEEVRKELGDRPHLISRDELLAAGALDVPPSWRKSLGGRANRQLDLFGDEDTLGAGQVESDDEDTDESH